MMHVTTHCLILTLSRSQDKWEYDLRLTYPPFKLHSQKRPSCNKSVDILQQLVTTNRYQDAFAWVATACDNKSVASCQQASYKLSTDLLQVDYFNRLVATYFNKL